MTYYDPGGEPISREEWSRLFGARRDDVGSESSATHGDLRHAARGLAQGWRKQTTVGDVRVSTVWLGLDHSFGRGQPLIWETMIFGGTDDGECYRYPTRVDHHEELTAQLRNQEENPCPRP